MARKDRTASIARRLLQKAMVSSEVFVVIIAVVLVGSFVNHRVRLLKEDSLIMPPGTMGDWCKEGVSLSVMLPMNLGLRRSSSSQSSL